MRIYPHKIPIVASRTASLIFNKMTGIIYGAVYKDMSLVLVIPHVNTTYVLA